LTRIFGNVAGGQNVLTFINSAQTPLVSALAEFYEIHDRFIHRAQHRRLAPQPPGRPRLGRSDRPGLGLVDRRVGRDDPAGYMLSASTWTPTSPWPVASTPPQWGIPRGMHIAAQSSGDAENYPFEQRHFLDRFGFGTRNRLNGVVLQLVASTTYTIPAIYA
jgi:hypothetical protein